MIRFTAMLTFFLSVITQYQPVSVQAKDSSPAKKIQPLAEIHPPAVINKSEKPVGHVKEISLLVVSKDGRFSVTADEDENNFIWDMKSGTLIREIGQPETVITRVVAAAFSPDSSQLLWARNGKIMPVLWDVWSGRRVGVLSSKEKGHLGHIVSMTFSADGRYIATGDTLGTVVIWNRVDRSVLRRIKAHSGEVRYLFFVSGRNELASAGSDGAVRLWGVSGTELLATLLEPSDSAVTALTGSADGQLLYAALGDMTIKGWIVPLRSLRGTLDFNKQQINSIALSPYGDFMAVAGEGESLLLWSFHQSKIVWKNQLDCSDTQVLFSPDGKQLFSSGGDNWIREWDVASGHLVKRFGGVDE